MRLQLAVDAAEHLALIPRVARYFDLIEVGTPLLKRFGVGAVATVAELSGRRPVVVDTKTADGGEAEARMVFGAGAVMMTVLASAAPETAYVTLAVAAEFAADVVFDTVVGPAPSVIAPDRGPSATGRWVGLHSSFDSRSGVQAGPGGHIADVVALRRRGFSVSLAGGIGPDNFAAVVESAPEIAVIGSSVTAAEDPEGVARWLRQQTDASAG